MNLPVLFLFLIFYPCVYGSNPEWGVWRRDLPSFFEGAHYEMAHYEIPRSVEQEQNGNSREKFPNFALCQLKAYAFEEDSCQTVNLLNENNLIFQSGGYPYDPDTQSLRVATEELKTQYDKEGKDIKELLNTKVSKAKKHIQTPIILPTKLRVLAEEITVDAERFQEIEEVRTWIEAWREEIQKSFQTKFGSVEGLDVEEGTSHAYDAEQMMILYLEKYREKIRNRDEEIIKKVEGFSKISVFVLHAHSRFDMCPFCLYAFHQKIQEWKQVIRSIFNRNLIMIVSSRQEYFPKLNFLYNSSSFPTYKGTMRSISIDEQSGETVSEKDFFKIVKKSLIIQVVLDPSRLYHTHLSGSTTVSGTNSVLGDHGSSSESVTMTEAADDQ